MDHGIFNVRTDVNACDCTQGAWASWESLHWKLTLERKSLAAPGNRTCVGGVLARCSTNWATSPPCCRVWLHHPQLEEGKGGEIEREREREREEGRKKKEGKLSDKRSAKKRAITSSLLEMHTQNGAKRIQSTTPLYFSQVETVY